MTILSAIAQIYKNKSRLTPQQRKTLIGQCKAGDAEGAIKGLNKILKNGDKNNDLSLHKENT